MAPWISGLGTFHPQARSFDMSKFGVKMGFDMSKFGVKMGFDMSNFLDSMCSFDMSNFLDSMCSFDMSKFGGYSWQR